MSTNAAKTDASLTASDHDQMRELANEAQCMVSNCATVFEMLRVGITSDWIDADTQGAAVMEFTRALARTRHRKRSLHSSV